MVFTLEEVKKFILEFTELEYQVAIKSFDNSINEKEWLHLVSKLEKCFGQRFGYFATVSLDSRSTTLMTEEILNNEKKNLLKRRLFLIRKYENPVFGKGILNTDSNVLFSCFLGSNSDMGAEVYPNNVSVGIVKGELKIISERKLNSEKRRSEEIIEWIYNKRSNEYLEDITIKKDGKIIETLRVFEPEHPTWMADYNS
jgi:hypothetical protein